jgi:predicted MPP superfamily phosphohydrolase
MALFLTTFIVLYGSLHFYAFIKLKRAFSLDSRISALIIFFMFVMVISPLVVHLFSKIEHESFIRILAYITYTWMGFLFLFDSWSFAFDIYRFFVYITSIILNKDLVRYTLAPGLSFFISLSFSFLVVTYGFFEATHVRTERLIIETSKIPKNLGRLKIVQISDVHLGLIVREERLRRIIKAVKEEAPDIFVSTGDLLDGDIDNISPLADMLHEIDSKYGGFAVTGNHEYYAGLQQAIDFTTKSGFSLLRGQGLTISAGINIAGVDDATGWDKSVGSESEADILTRLPRERFTLLLKHRPVIFEQSEGLFDLQLSGHTHGGQIFPFSLLTQLAFPTDGGLFEISTNSYLYVSRGAGTWGPPIRFLSPPEVTVIELVYSEKTAVGE